MSYRKLTKQEIVEIANQIKYQGEIDLKSLRAFVKKWWPAAVNAVCSFSSEYNDETYDQNLSSITAFNAKGLELPEPDFKGDEEDEYHDEKCGFDIDNAGGSGDSGDDWGDVVVFMDASKITLPDLYVLE